MSERNFRQLLQSRWEAGKFVCVGLDSELGKIPDSCRRGLAVETIALFNEEIIDQTHKLVCAYKPNLAFYLAYGIEGLRALKLGVEAINREAPDVPVILDAKWGDIGNTNSGYVAMAFDWLKVDAVTVSGYLGIGALKPFLDRKDKGVIILCRTSNSEAGEFQDLEVRRRDHLSHLHPEDDRWEPLYLNVARQVAGHWNQNGNCALVVGATRPAELKQVRETVGDDMAILIPAVGAQGGDVEASVKAGRNSRGQGMIINSSRGIIFASSGPDFAEAAGRATQDLHDEITRCLQIA